MSTGSPVQSPPKIDLLPEHLIDQIKAGEVIERPGNLIKEILENAVDAGATKLEVLVKNNGLDLISLKDNGHGMRFSDLPLAFSRHATSKISRFEDLYRLNSFGFRGEALASISAISKLQCLSKTSDEESCSEIKIEGGQTMYHGQRQTSSFSHGTELVIQDLFYNTPARLKFIQSQQAEKTFIKRILFAFILSRPEIEFQIKIDDAEKEIYPARTDLKDRIKDIFPKASGSVLYSQRFYENYELDLFLVPGSFRGPLKLQNIYINNRFILDKQLHRVMANGLDAAFNGEDFHYIVSFHLPSDTIDVNVHPNKTIIKVMEMPKMISLLSSTIKELGSRRTRDSLPATAPGNLEPAPSFFEGLSLTPTLQQERHEYNMDGFFSPHRLQENSRGDFLWVGQYLLSKRDNLYLAFSPQKLIEFFVRTKLVMSCPTIPLLVSEPFPSKGVRESTLKELLSAGVEIEYLGKDTLVLRGIPEWMNGFPLKEIVHCLLLESSFSEIQINPAEWAQSTWEEMLSAFSVDELISRRIAVDLPGLLKEKLK